MNSTTQAGVGGGATPIGAAASRGSDLARQRVLSRRRAALIGLGLAAVVTLAIAIVTGSWPLLVLSLVVDVMLAAYVALLLQLKQRKAYVSLAQPEGAIQARQVKVVG